MPNKDHHSLETFVHRALRDLPAERAPADLETRVFAALQARRRRPWWRTDWREWPVAPRVAVFALAALVAGGVAWGSVAGVRVIEAFDWIGWIRSNAPWLLTLGTVAETFADLAALLFHKFQLWVLAAVALVGASYTALIALGSGLYRRFLAHI